MNYIITNREDYFKGYNFCNLEEVVLPDKIAIDTESDGLKCIHTKTGFKGATLFAIQIGTGSNNYLFDLEGGIDPKDILKLCKGKILVLQNAMFDLRFFFKHGFIPYKVLDTMLASKILYNGGKDGVYTHNFGAIMKRELGITYDKQNQKRIAYIKLSNNSVIQYCFNDVDKLLKLEQVLANKLRANSQYEAYVVQSDATLPLAYMEMCGMPLSSDRWLSKIKKDEKDLLDVEESLKIYIISKFDEYRVKQMDLFSSEVKLSLNLNSAKQMIPVFEKLDINILDDKGKKSLNDKVTARSSKHEFVKMWRRRQKIQKALSTFGYGILDKAIEGRIYTSFNPMVDTSRISCRKGGINFLNFPRNKATRMSFLANEGFLMVGADYSNQEVFCGGDLHHDAATLKSILDGDCLHCAFARVLYPELKNLSDKVIKLEHPDKRQDAKSPRFNLKYLFISY